MEFPKESTTIDDLPEEIVGEILLKFPIEPLSTFNCVSKRWNSIISDPKLGRTYLQRAHLKTAPLSSSPLSNVISPYRQEKIEYLESYQIDRPQPPFHACIVRRFTISRESNHSILASSDGLVLSSPIIVTSSDWYLLRKLEFHVSNPFTKQSIELPCLKGPFSKCVFGFATRPGQGAAFVTYRVVIIQLKVGKSDVAGYDNCAIEIFSSDTGSWRAVSGLSSCPSVVIEDFTRAEEFCYKGILHWLDRKTRTIVTYDPFDSPNRFGHIQLPNGSVGTGVNMFPLGYEDSLKYGEMDHRHLRVWRLVNCDKGEWCLEQSRVIGSLAGLQRTNLVWRQLFVPNPWMGEYIRCMFELFGFRSNAMLIDKCLSGGERPLVPVVLCPWSSPFYSQAG